MVLYIMHHLLGKLLPNSRAKLLVFLQLSLLYPYGQMPLVKYPEPIVGIEGQVKVSMLGELIFKLFHRQFTFCVLHA